MVCRLPYSRKLIVDATYLAQPCVVPNKSFWRVLDDHEATMAEVSFFSLCLESDYFFSLLHKIWKYFFSLVLTVWFQTLASVPLPAMENNKCKRYQKLCTTYLAFAVLGRRRSPCRPAIRISLASQRWMMLMPTTWWHVQCVPAGNTGYRSSRCDVLMS